MSSAGEHYLLLESYSPTDSTESHRMLLHKRLFLNTNRTNLVYLQPHVYIRLVLYLVSNFNSLHKTNLFLAILLACGELGRMATLPEAIQ